MSRDCSVPWPGRKKETSFELQESRQETDRKIGWDKCHELVLTGISSCESLRSSCREGWLGCLIFFYQPGHFSYFARARLWASSDFFSRVSVLLQSSWAAHNGWGLLILSMGSRLCPCSVSGFFIYHVPKALSGRHQTASFLLLSLPCHQWLTVTHLVHTSHKHSGTLIKNLLSFLHFLAHLLSGKYVLLKSTTAVTSSFLARYGVRLVGRWPETLHLAITLQDLF